MTAELMAGRLSRVGRFSGVREAGAEVSAQARGLDVEVAEELPAEGEGPAFFAAEQDKGTFRNHFETALPLGGEVDIFQLDTAMVCTNI